MDRTLRNGNGYNHPQYSQGSVGTNGMSTWKIEAATKLQTQAAEEECEKFLTVLMGSFA